MQTTNLKDRFISGEARISYQELSQRGGQVIAWFSGDRWFFRHETEEDGQALSRHMSAARARYFFPSDAVEVVELRRAA